MSKKKVDKSKDVGVRATPEAKTPEVKEEITTAPKLPTGWDKEVKTSIEPGNIGAKKKTYSCGCAVVRITDDRMKTKCIKHGVE